MIEPQSTRRPRLAPEGVSFDPVPDHPGLVCETKGCTTRLNRYNETGFCGPCRTADRHLEPDPGLPASPFNHVCQCEECGREWTITRQYARYRFGGIEEYRKQHPLCRGCAARARQGAA